LKYKIRILHVIHSFSAGGLENGIVNIINNSPAHLEHELCFLTRGGEFLDRLKRPIVCHELQKPDRISLGVIKRLCRLYRERGIDVIHTRNWAAFDGVIAACLAPGPILIHGEHGRDMTDPKGTLSRRNRLRRLLSYRIKTYVAVTAELAEWLRQTVGIHPTKIIHIPNGVDTHRFRPVRDPLLRRELGITESEFVVGTIGRLDPVKNHLGLIASIDTLCKRGREVRLVIVGEGPMRGPLENRLMSWEGSLRPILTGYRPDAEKFYGIFDVFVLNSFAEGMSNTILEAMASGLTVVCTSVGGNRELIENTRTGFLVPAGDDDQMALQIEALMTQQSLRNQCGGSARSYVEGNHSLANMVQAYVGLYESLGGLPSQSSGTLRNLGSAVA
jgi:sugar transferase (PEP-CTERM/EpsH1 system associated)